MATTKKETLKAILRDLHGGLSIEQARDRVLREVGVIETGELVRIEQELIEEGLPADEVTRFCNVHVLLVRGSLAQSQGATTASVGPVSAFKRENAEIRRLASRLGQIASAPGVLDRENLRQILNRLAGLSRHYEMKENLIFPYLERNGFSGPSKVMWQKDNEIRALHKTAVHALADLGVGARDEERARSAAMAFRDEAVGMADKEEDILLPAAAQRLNAEEWAKIAVGMDELGYAFLTEAGSPASSGQAASTGSDVPPRAAASGAAVVLPSGSLTLAEIEGMLNTLPLDITFVDAEDRVRYFSEGRDRIFVRTHAVIGRSVADCHPPKSLPAVQRVLTDFKTRAADHHDFWIQRDGRTIHIRYFAVRAPDGRYLGTLEVTQDVTGIQALDGEKRLVGPAKS